MNFNAYFAGGCFWCTEAIFNRVSGVEKVLPGYIGGRIKNPCYKEVCSGLTGHTEGVEILFDSNIVSYEILLLIFFTTHDPTTLNRQGNDIGTQYRSSVFYETEKEKEIVYRVIKKLKDKAVYENPIITEVCPKTDFYYAEQEHKEFFDTNKQHPYCQAIISPKINKFIKEYGAIIK
tara:strand:- start:787 stop:1317 length:531 start_codon:yes stop_codon:yes gene_type:complete